MALLGIISLAQIWFIPGYLLLSLARNIRPLDKALLAVPVSAVVNFFLVYVLVLFGAYTQPVIIGIFAAEILALLLLKLSAGFAARATPPRPLRIEFDASFTNIAFGVLALICSVQFINQIGTVFTQGDAVLSWNHWAISWFNGEVPHGIAWYPQLLPTLYSLTYQFMGDSRIELFAKIGVGLYPLVALAIFARMAALMPTERNRILWAAIILFLLVRRLWGTENTTNGYADFPLAFFCISILYVFILRFVEQQHRSSFPSDLPAILVGVAIGAGLMKQSGVYLGMLVPAVWFACFRNNAGWNEHVRRSLTIGLSIAAGYSVWYLYQYWRISTGIETSNLNQLSGIVALSWYESIVYGFKGITYKLSWLWAALFLASLAHRNVRYLSTFAVMPLFLLWAAFVPYDYRNLAAIFPLLAVSLSYGWAELAGAMKKLFHSRRISPASIRNTAAFAILAGLAIALSNPKYNNELLRLSNSAKMNIGDSEINSRLLAYFESHPEPSFIATPYAEISKIPALAGRYRPLSCGLASFGHAPSLEAVLPELADPAIGQILLLPWCDAKLHDYFANQPDKYNAVFRHNGAVFYEVRTGK